MKQRIMAAIVAAMLCVSMSVPAFAATGYASGTVEDTSYTPAVSTEAETQMTEAKIEAAVDAAVKAETATAVVKVKNVKTVETKTLKKVAEEAKEENKKASVHFDQTKGNKVTTRVTVDPAAAANLKGELNVYASVEKKDTQKASNVFNKYFTNKTAVVHLGQSGAYGMNVKVAAKVDLSGMDTSALKLYVYNAATNTYSRLTSGYAIDANGYLHFITPVGGSVIISNGALKAK